MTIDNGAPPPEFLRLGPPIEPEVDIYSPKDDYPLEVIDPLRVVARNIRGLTLEHATQMAEAMGDIALRDRLNKWAVAYMEGGELPLKIEKERRI